MTDEKRQPVYTPPPAPGVLPDGKRVFAAGYYLKGVRQAALIFAVSEVEARGRLEDQLQSAGLRLQDLTEPLAEITHSPFGHWLINSHGVGVAWRDTTLTEVGQGVPISNGGY